MTSVLKLGNMIRQLRKIGSLATLVLTLILAAWQLNDVFAQQSVHVDTPSVGSGIATVESSWRYTRQGWRDSTEWEAADRIVHPPQRPFDQLHPATLALLILFSVLVSMLWASNEWEVAQLLHVNSKVSDDATRSRNLRGP